MTRSAQSVVCTVIAIAGLFSAAFCQTSMLAGNAASPTHHAAGPHEIMTDHPAAHEHHAHDGAMAAHEGTDPEESAPDAPCCVIQPANTKTSDAFVLLPETVTVAAPASVQVADMARETTAPMHTPAGRPPGDCGLRHRTSVLLI